MPAGNDDTDGVGVDVPLLATSSSQGRRLHHHHRIGSHVQFKIGDGTCENLDVLERLLSDQNTTSSPAAAAAATGVEGVAGSNDLHRHSSRTDSAESNLSEAASSECSAGSDPTSTTTTSRALLGQKRGAKEVLVELYDLNARDNGTAAGLEGYWEETARWVKYEEDVEGVSHRWGLPHVAFLSFHALLQLRKCMTKGVYLLDTGAHNYDSLCDLISNAMGDEAIGGSGGGGGRGGGGASPTAASAAKPVKRVLQALQLRHNHVPDRKMSRISTAATALFEKNVSEKLSFERKITQQKLSVAGEAGGGLGGRSASDSPLAATDAVTVGATGASGSASATALRRGSTDSKSRLSTRASFTAHSQPTIEEDDEENSTIQSGQRPFAADRFPPPRNSTPNVTWNAMDTLEGDAGESRHKPSIFAQPKRRQSIAQFMSHTFADLRKNTLAHQPSELFAYKGDVVLKNLSKDAESAQVFVGEINSMKRARFVMVRLAEATPMPEIVEAGLPIRFVFVILGPPLADGSYHELGRAIATLMANKGFCLTAYCACERGQLVEAVDAFLDGSVVIPPGEVDSKRLLSSNEIAKALKRRRKEAEMSKQSKTHPTPTTLPDAATKHAGSPDSGAKGLAPNGGAKSPVRPKGGAQRDGGEPATNNGGTRLSISTRSNSQSQKSQGSGGSGKRYRFFNGMMNDLRNRLPKYLSDFIDAANFQCLTSMVFMFFASFAPAITFGGLLGKYTDERMGTIETLFAQCICGVLWGLFSAQPLLIMSATGPVLIFEASLYNFCENLHLDFLAVRLYAGAWIFLISICIVALDGSRLLGYVTRFTEDIFATLISAIFIAESLHFIWHTFQENPVEDYKFYQDIHMNCQRTNLTPFPSLPIVTPFPSSSRSLPIVLGMPSNASASEASTQRLLRAIVEQQAHPEHPVGGEPHQRRVSCSDAEPNTALLTAIIMFATFTMAFMLKKLRESFYLGRHLRRAIGDFGVLISIGVVALLAHLCIPDPYLDRLDMPDHLNFTNPEARGHGLIVSGWMERWHGVRSVFVALAAALLVFILLFVETEITELLLMRKERGCRKGSGMNWDLVLMGFCAFLCSLFGLPWMCAAAVQSLAHCSSLTVMKKKAPGARPEVDHVIEQRVTTIGVSLLIGMITLCGSYLRLPLASLFGVFLYLGVMNLTGVQLIQRVVLFFIPEKYFPVTNTTEEVGIWRMHLYTWIQLGCLFLVYAVKYFKRTALAFPFVLMMFIVLRQALLPKIFSQKELKAIDGEDESEDDEWMDKDFYENARIPV